ncbi:annexin A2-like, partial [Lampetra fluviatilis]
MMVSNLMSYMCRDEGDLEMELPVGFRGILFRDDGFQADKDAEAIQAAIKTKGVDEAKIIDVITRRDNAQRRQVAIAYQMAYGKDMSVALKAALSGGLEEVVLGLLKTPAQFDADALRGATKGLGTDEECLIEILATRSNQQLRDIKQAYLATYKVELEKSIASDTSGDFQKLLLTLAK